jgi:hypothetical protein
VAYSPIHPPEKSYISVVICLSIIWFWKSLSESKEIGREIFGSDCCPTNRAIGIGGRPVFSKTIAGKTSMTSKKHPEPPIALLN